MKIDKITFKNHHAWIVVKADDGIYLGTWHIVHTPFVEAIQKEMPNKIKIWREND